MQTTSHILMIRPVDFGFNQETAVNNAFQVAGDDDWYPGKSDCRSLMLWWRYYGKTV